MNVVHVITGLQTGGAEMMLARLLGGMDRDRFASTVISLTEGGPVSEEIQRLGIPVHTLGMRPGVPHPVAVARLTRLLRRQRPDLVQTWMYHADLLGGVAAKVAGSIPVAWGVHSTNLAPGIVKRGTILTARTCARLSAAIPAAIVCCSEATRNVHARAGYRADKLIVIPNGFDLERFRPHQSARITVRQELGIPIETPLIGLLARFHPQKGHHDFIAAAGQLAARRPDAHFLLCGDGVTWDNARLATWIDAAGLRPRCHLLGLRRDTPRLQASLDIGVSSSVAVEALSLTIGEAMACAVPCVVTNVGDSAWLVGETGRVVPPGNPGALATAWAEVLSLDPAQRTVLGQEARQRITDHFSLPRVVDRYQTLYERISAVSGNKGAS